MRWNRGTICLMLPVLLIAATLTWAAAPSAPKVSTFAPVKETTTQADKLIADLNSAVASEDEYKDNADNIAQDANTLIVVAQALGLHDEDNKYRGPAEALVGAAQVVAAAKDFDAAKKAVAGVNLAAAGQIKTAHQVTWERKASLEQLMKKVPNVNMALKKNVKRATNPSAAADAEGRAAVLAIIAQAAMANMAETKAPAKADQWYTFCAEMRDAAADVNKSLHAGDHTATAAAMDKLQQSCEDCHKVFKPE